jgi:uncharacterized protein
VIAYFDTSAVVPLLIAEPGSARAASLWDSADRVVSVRLLYPETRAALAQAERLGRLTARHLRDAVTELDSFYAVSFRTSWPGRGSAGTAGMVPSRPAW